MKRFGWIAVVLICFLSPGLYAQMTDAQILNYVKAGLAAGKSQAQISTELLARGVTPEQAERIKSNFEAQQTSEESVTAQALSPGVISRDSRREAMDAGDGVLDVVAAEAASPENQRDGSWIYGHDIFNGRTVSFEPNENAATPENYRLGPGDELHIEIWGYSEASYTQTISPEGRINISQVGPIQLSGLTIKEASEKLRKALVSKYASIGGSRPNTSVSVTLGRIRTIQVNILGEVNAPGTYRLSSFSTVFHALYRANGVKPTGSMRAIRVMRGGEVAAQVDVYEYLLGGRSETDITLQEGDIVMVPPYLNVVSVSGSVKRPMSYELRDGETLSTLIDYAGGFTSDAFQGDLRLIRQKGEERRVFNVSPSEAASFEMVDGDYVTVGSNLDRFANRVEVRGYVFRPGMFELGGNIATVRQLVEVAGGLKEDAFLPRAVLLRERDDLSLETISFDLSGVVNGTSEDILLRKNDILVVSGIYELQDRGSLTINGMVASPGTFPFAENTTVEDLILQAGGLLEGASTARVDIARRVKDPTSLTSGNVLGESFSFAIKDGLAVDGGDKFVLQPYDVVSVRRSPGFKPQRFVEISGEVNFPGRYVLIDDGERISQLIERAGGPTSRAYLHGAVVIRHMNEEELRLKSNTLDVLNRDTARDTVFNRLMDLSREYTVGVEVDKAFSKPGSKDDLILRAGDEIFVPELINTVSIQGNVMLPNTVLYEPGKGVSYYINLAGGYGFRAKRNKVHIVYQNGRSQVAGSQRAKIEPGCMIMVPTKPERRGMDRAEVMAITSASSSLATLAATVFGIIRGSR